MVVIVCAHAPIGIRAIAHSASFKKFVFIVVLFVIDYYKCTVLTGAKIERMNGIAGATPFIKMDFRTIALFQVKHFL